jgi:DNA gyrase/topoisomerase IV subunit B
MRHTNRRENGAWVRRYERGLPHGPLIEIERGDSTGTSVHFRPDTTVFGDERLSAQVLKSLCSGFSTSAEIEILVA